MMEPDHDVSDIGRDTEIAARLALSRVLQALFMEAADAADGDPPQYLCDMYCLLRAAQISSVPFREGEAPDDNEETMRQVIGDMEDHLHRLQRIYGLDRGLVDTERGEMIEKAVSQRRPR